MTQTPTAEKIQQWLDDAAAAVHGLYAASPDAAEEAERVARREVTAAVRLGHTAAVIASAAGVRQRLVAKLIDDQQNRAAALVAARHDAEREQQQVLADLRAEAQRRWYAATEHDGGAPVGTKAAICEDLDISRTTLDDWLS